MSHVPPVRCRAAFGQVVGLGTRAAVVQYPTLQPNLHAYAIIGAAGMLGGVTRMTVSCTVLVMETTGSLQVRVPSSVSPVRAHVCLVRAHAQQQIQAVCSPPQTEPPPPPYTAVARADHAHGVRGQVGR